MHSTALIDTDAKLGAEVTVGPFSVIENNVTIGANTRIDSHSVVSSGVRIGKDCHIFNSVVLGTTPQDLKFGGEQTELVIGNGTVIREFCMLNRGTANGGGVTTVGSDCMLMAYSHIAHDCHVGNNVILANVATLSGHVTIEDNVGVGGLSAFHQFVQVGQHCFIGGMARVTQDVPPYVLTSGFEMKYRGPNSVGLRRRGFTMEQITAIKHAYSFIYRSKLNLTQAVNAIHDDMEITPEVQNILDFIEKSKRGLMGRGKE